MYPHFLHVIVGFCILFVDYPSVWSLFLCIELDTNLKLSLESRPLLFWQCSSKSSFTQRVQVRPCSKVRVHFALSLCSSPGCLCPNAPCVLVPFVREPAAPVAGNCSGPASSTQLMAWHSSGMGEGPSGEGRSEWEGSAGHRDAAWLG